MENHNGSRRFHNDGGSMAADSWSRKLRDHISTHKQEVELELEMGQGSLKACP